MLFKRISVFLKVAVFLFVTHSCTKEEVATISDNFPSKLSGMGVFQNQLSDLTPTGDYTFYELSTELFSDYSEKQRLIKLPPGEQLIKMDDGLPSFPDGTVLVKTFYYWKDKRTPALGKQIVETRFLRKENDDWKVAVYKWNEEQTEGFLLTSGFDEPFNWIDENGTAKVTTYHIPSTFECITCHISDGKFEPIGPKLYNLNTSVERGGLDLNQLLYFQQNGLINSFNISLVDNLPTYMDQSLSIEKRGRAYMEVNCSHCHAPGGFSDYLKLDLRFHTLIGETGIVDGKSKMIDQVSNGSMPYLGTSILDDEGVQVIIDYVNSL